jgi:hypothetical protein
MRKFLAIAAVMLLSLANAYGQTVQDSNYRTIGYAKGIPASWTAYYFFFFKS